MTSITHTGDLRDGNNHENSYHNHQIRGGTSKGLFIDEAVLPPPGKARDTLLLAMIGSPDPSGMQLNGLGGGISSTSKVALIRPSERNGIDVNYLFGQVSLKEPLIDWSGSCGNLRGFYKTPPKCLVTS